MMKILIDDFNFIYIFMNIVSLFWGIECWRVAFEIAKIPVDKYYSSEIDPYAIKISSANYNDIVHIGDIQRINRWCSCYLPLAYDWRFMWKMGNDWIPNILFQCKDIDIIIGGSPCQDLSIANKNWKWLDWEKSGLFYEYARILRQVKPKWFLLENVASMRKLEKEKITNELRRIYPDVKCYTFDSILTSAWKRNRHYWTNIPGIIQPDDRWIYLKDILEDIPLSDPMWKPVKPEYLETLRSMNWWMTEMNKTWRQRQWYEFFYPESKLGSFTVSHASNRKIIIAVPKKSLTITASYAKKNQKNFFKKSDGKMIIARDDMNYYARKLTVREWARVMNLPETFIFPVSYTRAFYWLWNWWDAWMIAHILSFIPR